MSKKNFISLILGTIGGILFALGMCMTMLPEWDSFKPGVLIGVLGAVILLIMVMVRRKMARWRVNQLSSRLVARPLAPLCWVLLAQ